MIDATKLGAELAAMVKAQITPALDRLAALEKRFDCIPTPKDGKDADIEEVCLIIADELKGIKDTVNAIQFEPAPELPDIPKMIDEAIEAKLGVEDMERSIEEVVRAVVAEIPVPQDGKDGSSISVEDVMPALEKRVDDYLAAIQAPENGKDGRDGIDGKDGAPGEKGEAGRDGLDVKGLFRAEGGRLVATMSDGSVKDLGEFVGKDGEPGAPGRDGADGVGFDDLSVQYDGEKSFTLKFTKGERVKEFSFALPVMIDRGFFSQGKSYQAGDGVTWAGNYWIAQKDTDAKPGEGTDWRIAVKRGRDGKTFTVNLDGKREPINLKKTNGGDENG